MIKRIKDLTEKDKQQFFENSKRAVEEEQGIPWEFIERKMLEDIDNTFDDIKFGKMEAGFAIDAAYAREYFRWNELHEKPSLVDYMIWMGYFVTKSEYIDLGD